MKPARIYFLVLSALIALAGLFAIGMAHDYLQFFGFGLVLFGLLFGFSRIKQHYDEQEAARH